MCIRDRDWPKPYLPEAFANPSLSGLLWKKVNKIKSNSYKIRVRTVRSHQVYDLKKDPEEKNDFASTAKGKEAIVKLFPRLLKLQKKMGDKLDLKSSFPQLASK